MSKLVPIQDVGLENITPFTHETFERRAFLWTFLCPSSLSESQSEENVADGPEEGGDRGPRERDF